MMSKMKKLKSNITGLTLDSPTMLAAGIVGISSKTMARAVENGAGAVVTKSIGFQAREGNKNPVVAKTPCGLLNSMGLPNPGVHVFRNEVKEFEIDAPVIGSVYGFTQEEYVKVADLLSECCDGIELNLSCPNVRGTGTLFGQDPSLVEEVTKAVKATIQKPLFVKLTPNVTDITEIAEAAEAGGADAITAINTVNGMRINIELEQSVLAAETGGLSGPAIRPIAVHSIYKIYQKVDIPVIGCGGITSWEHAVEFFLAGASAVQLGTGIMEEGFDIFSKINKGVNKHLDEKSYAHVSELIGNASNLE